MKKEKLIPASVKESEKPKHPSSGQNPQQRQASPELLRFLNSPSIKAVRDKYRGTFC